MKKPHKLQLQPAGPAWGLVFGVFMTAVGIGLWFYAKAIYHPTHFDESLAVATILIGVFSAVYSGREISHRKHR
ncbi:hypothetical protein GXB81_05565 [Paraburkholderia sp. Ac-20336]|uniref:hypothetical protein n=1 Tax=Paraburkholderia sp. Ac-20336 TaxID=2703886 RepID=UPI00197F837D|nr:hypothetical protein [Paraburkholderia sp. Ac-20336]MBN3802523.1 hypothetical protein [Paraburkholderia sp. Ac-20336]